MQSGLAKRATSLFGTPATGIPQRNVLPLFFRHKGGREKKSRVKTFQAIGSTRGAMSEERNASPVRIKVLLADSSPMRRQLLSEALAQEGFKVSACQADAGAILQDLERERYDILVMTVSRTLPEMSPLRTIHLTMATLGKVVLLDSDTREGVVQAFRAGARGIFCLADSSFASLCDCVQRVYRGEIWATMRQLGYLLDSVSHAPTLQVLTASGDRLLTSREEQVVALVADGLSNRFIATELGLSEHTVKKYLFRIFEKLGISNRVELVLYAVHHGAPCQPQWMASA